MKLPIKLTALLSSFVLAASAVPGTAAAVQISAPEVSQTYVLDSEDEAVLQIRQYLKEHIENFSVTVPNNGISRDEISYQLLYKAFDETGNGDEGDYLRFAVKGFKCTIVKVNDSLLKLTYDVGYYTTPEEETALTSKLNEVMNEKRFANIAGDFNKIRSIYYFVTSSVTYAEDENDPYAYTAYNALFNGTAVCQGVTQLLYRMFNDCGIPCRIIAGLSRDISNMKEGHHVWLIVKLEGQYYYLDPTWDMKFQGRSFYYFLKGTDDFDSATPSLMHIATSEDQKTFPDYQSDEFKTAYPIAKTAYPIPKYSYGDINGDKIIDAIDSSLILSEYARLSSGGTSSFSQSQASYADIDHSGVVDAVDASLVLLYYAKVSNGAEITLSDLIKNH